MFLFLFYFVEGNWPWAQLSLVSLKGGSSIVTKWRVHSACVLTVDALSNSVLLLERAQWKYLRLIAQIVDKSK